jgi:hypothetical protein
MHLIAQRIGYLPGGDDGFECNLSKLSVAGFRKCQDWRH